MLKAVKEANGFPLLLAGPNPIPLLLSSLNPVSFEVGFLEGEAGSGDFAELLKNRGGGSDKMMIMFCRIWKEEI